MTTDDTSTETIGRTAPDLDASWNYARTTADRLSIPDAIERRLLSARQREQVAVPFERDDGTLDVCEGYRVRHDDVRGPYAGPLRYAPELADDDCAGLAAATTVTAALASVPFGGAAGGIAVDPETLSRDERVRLTRSYATRISGVGPASDVLVPGVGTDERTMARFADAVADRVDGPHNATVAGKPPAVGGVRKITRAGGHSVARVAQDVLETEFDRDLTDATVAVYGTGIAGVTAARLLESWGGTIDAMCSDWVGLAAADEHGLDTDVTPAYLERRGALDEFDDGVVTGIRNVLGRDVDVLVLADPKTAVTPANVGSIRADFVVEAVHGGVTAEAQAVLEERGIPVVPDVLATAGRLIAAHLEWRNRLGRDRASDAQVTNELEYALVDTIADVRDRRERRDRSWREAAYEVGLSRIAAAHEVVR